VRIGVGKAEQDDARHSPTGQGGDLAEVQVEREDDSLLGDGLVEDLLVRQPVQSLVPQMHRVVTRRAQPGDDPLIHAHVGEETHDRRLRRLDLLLRQPGGVLDRLLDVLAFEIRVPLEDILERRPVRDLSDDHRDGLSAFHGCRPGPAAREGRR